MNENDENEISAADAYLNQSNQQRIERSKVDEIIDKKYAFEPLSGSCEKLGWLLNMHPTDVLDDSKRLLSAMNYYFVDFSGSRFKATLTFLPYFYLVLDTNDEEVERDVVTYLCKRFSNRISRVETIYKDNLEDSKHLVGITSRYLKLEFYSVTTLIQVRQELNIIINKNKEIMLMTSDYTQMLAENFSGSIDCQRKDINKDASSHIIEMREYDVPYQMRVSIDKSIFTGHWYTVKSIPGQQPELILKPDLVTWPELIVLAYDIETTKMPLKFPEVSFDQIMMISYMIDGIGYLLCNREIISEDIHDFEFTPKPEFPGIFHVENLANEKAVIERFFEHIKLVMPNVITSYNGDNFDWPFVEGRAKYHNIIMFDEIGFAKVKSPASVDYLSRTCFHLDCLKWVKRDSYLPVGAQGLKAVTKAKLNYNPVEVDPELMCKMARENPKHLANYSVSDAVATYYLYMKYVHPFIFALCTILPLNADDVLRKGSGTLCEALLMVEAFRAGVIFPHKQSSDSKVDLFGMGKNLSNNFTLDGHLIQSETYVGGHVEALECGIFRSDIPVKFRLVPAACEALKADARRCIKRGIAYELGLEDDQQVNELIDEDHFNKVVKEVEQSLNQLAMTPNRLECPIIYHLDVGAMYPNIILTNRLQPSAVVADANQRCSSCHFYKPGVQCQRFMPWTWRADVFSANRNEVYRIQTQLSQERFQTKNQYTGKFEQKPFFQLPKEEKMAIEKKRLQEFCRKAYKRILNTRIEEREGMICQRENSFYVDTVRAFRDRRYKFKGLTKTWKRKQDELSGQIKSGTGNMSDLKEANSMVVLYDSLQLAHKCILNSFYGYVMRRGARWYSMEMAGIVCHTGANIITRARELIEQVGRALELDTDGIWCILPASFPQNLELTLKSNKKVFISYPGAILNLLVQDLFTNDQYHELIDPKALTYKVRSENSIFFEVDGPYLAMILPSAKEEGKRLKKRYAVFNFDGSLAELKGFEIKRNGELQLIKLFQSAVFEAFLNGKTLTEVYESVAKVADSWLDILYSRGSNMQDCELFDLISENRSMSKKLSEYGDLKTTTITTAKRLAEFLGDTVVKESGLSCKFIVSKQPDQSPVTERVIPVAIFHTEPSVKRHFLRRWLKDNSISDDIDIREIIDWDYYIERLGSTIQKIITIPAAMQQVPNPVPRIKHPDWVMKKLAEKFDTIKQRKITDLMQFTLPPAPLSQSQMLSLPDIEEAGGCETLKAPLPPRIIKRRRDASPEQQAKDILRPWREQLPKLAEMSWSSLDGKEEILEYLRLQQEKWRIQRKQRALRKEQSFAPPSIDDFPSLAKRQRGLGGYIANTKFALTNAIWQVLEIVPDRKTAGHYLFWIILQVQGMPATLHQVRVNVNRKFYVNMKESKDEETAALYKKVADPEKDNNFFLPRNHPVFHLYEYSVPENLYILNTTELSHDLTKPKVAGVYESKVPGLFRLFTQVGCLCSFNKRVDSQQADFSNNIFDIDQLHFHTVVQKSYLDDITMRKTFLFHYNLNAFNEKDTLRQMYFLIVPWSARGYICIVDSSTSNKQIPNLTKLYTREKKNLFSQDTGQDIIENEEVMSCSQEEIHPSVNLPENIEFTLKVETDTNNARKTMNKWLTGLRQEKSSSEMNPETNQETTSQLNTGPIVILLHSDTTPNSAHLSPFEQIDDWTIHNHIASRRRVLQLQALDEYPVISLGGIGEETDLPGDEFESKEDSDAYSIMNWQATTIRRAMKFYCQSDIRYIRQLELAKYLHIPVGNIPVQQNPLSVSSILKTDVDKSLLDQPNTSAISIELSLDIFFARYLKKKSYIWWCSADYSMPDLGGKETDDLRLMIDNNDSKIFTINNPSSYSHAVIDVELCNLAVNTLLVSNRVHELEGATGATFDHLTDYNSTNTFDSAISERGANFISSTITSYDENAACSSAFKILKNMIAACVKEVVDFKNPIADENIVHFYQWLRSPRSLFYDPALGRLLRTLMKKIFLKLIEELKASSIDVVHGSYNRLILSAKKHSLEDTSMTIEALFKVLRKKPFFTHIGMTITSGWCYLLWLDTANFCGIKEIPLDADTDTVKERNTLGDLFNTSDGEEDEYVDDHGCQNEENPSNNITIDMYWHMAKYLPNKNDIRSRFETTIAGFIMAFYKMITGERDRINFSQREPSVEAIKITDFSLTPGVMSQIQALISEQLGPELYDYMIKAKGKTGHWIKPEVITETAQLTVCYRLLARSQFYLDPCNPNVKILHNQRNIPIYLEDIKRPLEANDEFQYPGQEEEDDYIDPNLLIPTLPPHMESQRGVFNPLLDFVKMLCHVLSMEKNISSQVEVIRQNLLRILGVSDFSSAALFHCPHEIINEKVSNRTLSLRSSDSTSLLVHIPDFICSHCNSIQDLDLCRDRNIFYDTDRSSYSWRCNNCQSSINKNLIEEKLIEQINDICNRHLLQDFRCAKCIQGGGIQEHNLANGASRGLCSQCSNALQLTIPTHGVIEKLSIYSIIGHLFELRLVESQSNWIIKNI